MSLEKISVRMHTPKRIVKVTLYVIIGRGLKVAMIGIAIASNPTPITVYNMIDNLVDTQSSSLLPSYEYIDVHYKNINTGDNNYALIQKAIFLGIIANKKQSLDLSRVVTRGYAYRFLNKPWRDLVDNQGKKNEKIGYDEWEKILSQITEVNIKSNMTITNQTIDIPIKSNLNPIFSDVYDKIKSEFLSSGNTIPSDDILIQGAIKGMTEAIGDQHSNYFVPLASKNFSDSLQGEFYGIGAYIDTKEPGILVISSTVQSSPAMKAGVKAGDRIIAIDDYMITTDTNPDEAISKIKGPKGTSVTLTILRGGETQNITIIRDKISIKPITTIEINAKTIVVSINSFSFGIDRLRSTIMNDIATKGYEKIIIDLRYNPGGSLDDVAHMLDYIVPKGEPAVIIRSRYDEDVYISEGVDLSKSLMTKKVIVLINKSSASASEILAGVIRDYIPTAQIIGETSYGKGSVQSLRDYSDGSSLKLTTAKWYTGKSKTNIDKKGISPDVIIVDDPKTETDEVIEWVKSH